MAGDTGGGTVFKIGLGGALATLYRFCLQSCSDLAGATGRSDPGDGWRFLRNK